MMIHVQLKTVLHDIRSSCESSVLDPRLCLLGATLCSHHHKTHAFVSPAVLFLTPFVSSQLVASTADCTHHLLLSSYSSLQYHSTSFTGIRSSHYHCLHCFSSTLGNALRLDRLGERGVKLLPINKTCCRAPRN